VTATWWQHCDGNRAVTAKPGRNKRTTKVW